MDNKVLSYIAFLESKVDMLETELTNIDQLLYNQGFEEGVATLKSILVDITEAKEESELPFDFSS